MRERGPAQAKATRDNASTPPVYVRGRRWGIDKSAMPNGVNHRRNRDRCVLLRNAVMRDNIDDITWANQDHTSPGSCLQGRDPPRDSACFLTSRGRQPSDSDLREPEEWSKNGPSNSGTDGRPRHVPSHATSIPDQKDTQGGPPGRTRYTGLHSMGRGDDQTRDKRRAQEATEIVLHKWGGGHDVRIRGG